MFKNNSIHLKSRFSRYFSLLIILVLAVTGSSCDSASKDADSSLGIDLNNKDTSVSTWIEYPLEGWIIPNQPVSFVVYAGGAEGVIGIKLSIDGQALPSLAFSDLSTDGSERQVRLEYPWQPPTEGPYILSASAVSKAGGATGGASQVNFCVVTCEEQETTPTPDPDLTPTPTPKGAATPTATQESQPQEENVPITEPPPPPPPADTDGPSIASSSLIFESCQFYGHSSISDASGVSWAKFGFDLNGEGWKWVWMQDLGGGVWQSEAGISLESGIGTPIGVIQYQIQAADTLGNETISGVNTHSYTSCDG